jgi:hypothetical protein
MKLVRRRPRNSISARGWVYGIMQDERMLLLGNFAWYDTVADAVKTYTEQGVSEGIKIDCSGWTEFYTIIEFEDITTLKDIIPEHFI